MRRTLPSVRALESFEAVARYGNVTRAAEELGRTQSAVSRQVANLETFARRKLFVRDRNHLTLNEAGRNYCRRISTILDALEVETVKLVSLGSERRAIRLGVSTTFGSRWLMPRLAEYAKTGGYADLCIAKGLMRPEFDREHIDAWIECSAGRPLDGVDSQHIGDEQLVAVVSPDLYHRNSVRQFDRLRLPTRFDAWRAWIDVRGVPPLTKNSLRFEDYSLMIEAACLGLGVAVVPTLYLENEFAQGRLIQPFGEPMSRGFSYWLTYPQGLPTNLKVLEFAHWLTGYEQRASETVPRRVRHRELLEVHAESA